ncbi:MAG: DUF2267 domain-containing protein [Candidatus Binatia bacterium]
MSTTGLEAFDATLQKTHLWLNDIMDELACEGDRHGAYIALRAVLHALRDHLTIEEATDLGAQLPMLIRGLYYEGWRPTGKPVKERQKEAFLAHIRHAFTDNETINVENVARAVFRVLARHVTAGEIADVKHQLPAALRALWPPSEEELERGRQK